MADTGGAPLWETLDASFPTGLFPQGLEYEIKGKIRRRIREIGYRVEFPEGEDWESIVECFALVGLEKLHNSFGENPWFWVVAWPSIFGAAAVDFWPDVGSGVERRLIASAAAHQKFEAVLIRRALGSTDVGSALPDTAVRGLKAIGQRTLPGLPTISLDTERHSFVPPRMARQGFGPANRQQRPPPRRPSHPEEASPALEPRKASCPRAVRITPGDNASYTSPTGAVDYLRAQAGAAEGEGAEALENTEPLAEGQRLRLMAMSGRWAKVVTDTGTVGWLPLDRLQNVV